MIKKIKKFLPLLITTLLVYTPITTPILQAQEQAQYNEIINQMQQIILSDYLSEQIDEQAFNDYVQKINELSINELETLNDYLNDVYIEALENLQLQDETEENAPPQDEIVTQEHTVEQLEQAQQKALTKYEMGDYDILVYYDGEYKHPKDIANFFYNDGHFPQYPKGWLSSVTEILNAQLMRQRASMVEMFVQVGYVVGNGYQTFINELQVNGAWAWCAERSKEPVSYASNYNDGAHLTNIKQSWAMWIGYDDAIGIMGTSSHFYKYGIVQANVWHFENTLERNATVYIHGHGDVSAKYRQVIDEVNNAISSTSLGFNKASLSTSFDNVNNTIITEAFKLTDTSRNVPLNITLSSGYYVTESHNNTVATTLQKGKEYVIRTTILTKNETITLTASYIPHTPKGRIYHHNIMSNYQAVIRRNGTDPVTESTQLTATFSPAFGSVEIPKSHQNMPSSFVYNYNNYSVELFDNTGTSIDTKTIAPSITSESKIVFDNLPAGNYYAIETINNPNVVANQNRVDFTIVADQITVVSKANGFINTLAIGNISGIKLITTNANPDVVARYDLTQVVANIRSEDGTYNQNHNFDINGNLQVNGLYVGKYFITEVAAPTGLTIDSRIIEVTVTSNATVHFTFNNKEEVGNLKILKRVNRTTTNEIAHDHTKIKLRIESLETHVDYDKTFYMNANGTLEINNLPIGNYKVTELEVPNTMKLNVVPQTVAITNNATVPIEIVNDENTVNVNIKKKVTNNTNAITNDDLTKIEIRIRSLDTAVKYDETFNLNVNGELLLTNLAFARYEVTEVNCPSYMKRDTTVHIINANIDGRTYQVEFENIISAGVLKIEKDVSKTTNHDVTINHDFTQVKIRIEAQEQYITYSQDFYLNAAGTITVNNLPIGKYKITELEVPETMQLTATPQIVEVVEGVIATAKGTAKLVNTESLTHIRVKKAVINPTTIAALPIDYTKITVRIVSTTANVKYDKTFNLNTNGELEVKNLAYATYTVAEVSCPDYMDMDPTIHTITSISHNQTYEVVFDNILIASKVKIAKDNSDGGTMPRFVFGMYRDILRWEDGTPKVFGIDSATQTYKAVAEPKGTLVNPLNQLYYQGDEVTRIFGDLITGADGTFTTAEFPYQFKNVWVQELATPPSSYVYLDYMPKQVALVPDGTASVKFIDIIKRPGMLQINKRNEDGEFVAWYFDIYALHPNTTEKIYLETISTSGLDGIGRSTMLQLIDSNGEKIKLFVKEQPHTLYATSGEFIEVTDEMWNSGRSIFILDMNNIYKRLNLKGFKIMLENTINAIADGAEFTLFNNLDEEIGTAIVKNNEFVFIDLRADIITKEMYILETKTPTAAILNSQKIMLPDIDLDNVQDGDTVLINSKDSPIINEPTITEFTKVDVTGEKEVCGAMIELIYKGTTITEGVSCESSTTWTGLDKGEEYTIKETLVPSGYQHPIVNEVKFTVNKDGSITHVMMKNELTKLIYHKLEGTAENPTENYVIGAEIGVRLIERPDITSETNEISLSNDTTTSNNLIHEDISQYDKFSTQITATTTNLTKQFLNAKIGDTVFTFITTGELQEFLGIPVGFTVEFYEITAPIGYELAEPVFITIPETDEVIVKQFDDLTIFELPKTGNEFLIMIILGSGLLLSSSAYIAVMIVAKKYDKLYELEMKLRKK